MTDAEALDLIPFVRLSYNTKNFTKDSYTAMRWFDTVEDSLKRKTPPQLEGDWLKVSVEGWDLINRPMIRCSHCGWTFSVALNPRNFCPSCGAKMK